MEQCACMTFTAILQLIGHAHILPKKKVHKMTSLRQTTLNSFIQVQTERPREATGDGTDFGPREPDTIGPRNADTSIETLREATGGNGRRDRFWTSLRRK